MTVSNLGMSGCPSTYRYLKVRLSQPTWIHMVYPLPTMISSLHKTFAHFLHIFRKGLQIYKSSGKTDCRCLKMAFCQFRFKLHSHSTYTRLTNIDSMLKIWRSEPCSTGRYRVLSIAGHNHLTNHLSNPRE